MVIAVAAAVLAGAAPAGAKGASLRFDRRYLVVGETVTARATVLEQPSSPRLGTVADGPFVAYLLPADTWIDPPHVPPDAVPLGTVVINDIGTPGGMALVRLTFTVPDVPAGGYTIGFCNDPCRHSSVGDLFEGWVQVVATPLEARVAALADELDRGFGVVTVKQRRQIRQLVRITERLDAAGTTQESLTGQVSDLRSEVAALRRATDDEAPPWPGWVVGLGVALVVGSFVLGKRRGSAGASERPEGREELGREATAEQAPGHGVQETAGRRRVHDGAAGSR